MNAETIHKFPLFANIPADELTLLGESMQECDFQTGEVMFAEGSLTEHFYFVLQGDVEIIKSLGTVDERVLALSTAGSILGEMSMFSKHGSHTASARAHTPTRLLRIPFVQFNQLMQRHPEIAYDLLRLYSRRLEDSESLTIQDLREKNRQLVLAYRELQAAQAAMIEKEKLEHELQLAAEIQRDILPEGLPNYPGLEFGALMIPARQVGGDFYDFIPLGGDRLGIVVGDVCDKGIPSALFMALSYSSVRTEAARHDSPSRTLQAVNQHLLQINRSTMFVTLLYGVLDCKNGSFSYARAGHPAPLLLDENHQPVDIPFSLGQPVGLFDEPAIDQQCITIPAGGTLLVFSDGLSETVEGTPGSLPLARLCSDLRSAQPQTQEFCQALWRSVGGPAGSSLIQDDFTLVAVKHIQDNPG